MSEGDTFIMELQITTDKEVQLNATLLRQLLSVLNSTRLEKHAITLRPSDTINLGFKLAADSPHRVQGWSATEGEDPEGWDQWPIHTEKVA